MKKVILILLAVCFLSGCADGDRFDNLIVVDGDGRKLLLKHNFADTYFIDVVGEDARTKNLEINNKLIKGETK